MSVDAYQWERVSAGACLLARISRSMYRPVRLVHISGNVYLFVFSVVFFPLCFAAAVIPHFLLRFLEDSA